LPILVVSLASIIPATLVLSAGDRDAKNVRLVLQVTVDGLRRDMLDRYEQRFSTELRQRVQRNFHPDRSGEIYVVHDLYWFNFDKGSVAAMHGSPWRFDTHVPVIFAGPGIDNRVVHRLVHPVDVAPTLSALLGMTAPGAAQESVLPELLGKD